MRNQNLSTASKAFTLIEMFVVIAIIGILAGMLAPALIRAKIDTHIQMAKVEMKDLVAAIYSYQKDYSVYPAPLEIRTQGIDPVQDVDYTFGTVGTSADKDTQIRQGLPNKPIQQNNSAVMAILLNVNLLDKTKGNIDNKRAHSYYTPRMTAGTNSPGLSTLDYVLRDPWGNPYIITLDLNYDDKCRDALYCLNEVSEISPSQNSGHNGLARPKSSKNSFEANTGVMVWSFGLDKKAAWTGGKEAMQANKPLNKDNLLSWP
jgi:prepilin-type N-terminal cleavage/methylation domain-containing protein